MQNRTTSCDAEIWVVSWKDLLADFIKDKRETGASKIGIDFSFAFFTALPPCSNNYKD